MIIFYHFIVCFIWYAWVCCGVYHTKARSLALSRVLLIQGETLEPEILLDKAWERVTLRFNDTFSCGMAVLQISYTGEMGKDMAGLYSSRRLAKPGLRMPSDAFGCRGYQSPQGWKSMALTQFEAVDARRMLPCWDEPSRKAVFVGSPRP